MVATATRAYDFVEGGIYYNVLDDGTSVEVTYATDSYNSYSGVVDIPETAKNGSKEYTVTAIGSSAFRLCDNLTSITVPNTINSIGSSAFYQIRGNGLKTVDFSQTSITSVPQLCFYLDSYIETIKLPETVTSFGDNCFHGCEYLSDITIPDALEELGEKCFYLCWHIESMDLSKTKITSLPTYCFYENSYLTSLILPSTLKEIDTYCFQNCGSLASLDLPDGLETIGKHCFRSCSRLSTLTLPASVTSVGSNCFYQCTGIKTLDASQCTNLTEFPDYCFYGCTALTSVLFPSSITSLGNWCFNKCTHLTEADLSETALTEMLIYCFDGCIRLESVKVPNSLARLEQNCFAGCTALKEIDLSETQVVNFGGYAFSGCTSLETVGVSPDNLSYGMYCFEDCTSLKSIDFAYYITTIPEGCFSGCTSLTEINLNDWCSSIADKAFYNCSNIMSFQSRYLFGVPSTSGTPFEGMNTDECVLYVPYGEVSRYAAATNWKEFQHIEQYGENYYNAIVAKADSVSTRFNEVWAIITSYGLADDYQDMYTTITEGIDQILYLAEVRFVNAGLDKSNGERYLAELDQIAEAIEKLLADAEAAHETTGINYVGATLNEDVQIYTISGIRVDSPTKGDVYVVRHSDGTTKKVLMK